MSSDVTYTFPSFTSGTKTAGSASIEYLACLIDPEHYQARYPSEFSTPTALYHSINFFDVYGNFAAGTLSQDIGRFAFMIRPILGSYNPGANSCQVSYYDPSVAWPIDEDFTNPSGNRYKNVQDPNLTALIGPDGASGLVKEIRPVAQSAWFAFTAPAITLGGQVAMALTDGNSSNWNKNYNTNRPPGYPLQEYSNLAVLPMSYQGKITEGTYGFYKPYDEADVLFRGSEGGYNDLSSYGAGHSYPSLIIAGQLMNTASGAFTGPIGRIRIDTVFEYVTSSLLVYSSLNSAPPLDATIARRTLQGVIPVMSNDEHGGWLSSLLSVGKNLLSKAAPVIGTALGGLIGGPPGAALGGSLGGAVSRATSTPSTGYASARTTNTRPNQKPTVQPVPRNVPNPSRSSRRRRRRTVRR